MDRDKLIKEIEEMLGYKITGMTLFDLEKLSDDCFVHYDDLIGHRLDKLVSLMQANREGVLK